MSSVLPVAKYVEITDRQTCQVLVTIFTSVIAGHVSYMLLIFDLCEHSISVVCSHAHLACACECCIKECRWRAVSCETCLHYTSFPSDYNELTVTRISMVRTIVPHYERTSILWLMIVMILAPNSTLCKMDNSIINTMIKVLKLSSMQVL